MPLIMGSPHVGGYFADVSFDLAATANLTSTNPWVGSGLTGEFGVLAGNDNHATTIYEYVPKHIPAFVLPVVAAIPEPTGNPSLPGSSQVNPHASDEFLVVDNAGWLTARNNATYRKVFIAKGSDLHTASQATLTVSGSEGNPRFLCYWDYDTPSNVHTIAPWNLPFSDRVTLPTTRCTASWTVFVGLSHGRTGVFNGGIPLSFQSSAVKSFAYRCHSEANQITAFRVQVGSPTDCGYYQCLCRSSNIITPGQDVHGFNTQGSVRAFVISCESFDMHGDCFQSSSPNDEATILEDNDFYRTPATYFDGLGNQDNNGLYGNGEHGIAFKATNANANPQTAIIRGNRIWGLRLEDPVATTGSTSGGLCIEGSSPGESGNRNLRITENVMEDCTGEFMINFLGLVGADDGFNSVTANLMYNHNYADGTGWAMRMSERFSETYHNTFKDCEKTAQWFSFITPIESADWMGNLSIDSGTMSESAASLDANSKVGYGGFAGTSVAFEKGFSGTNETSSTAALNMGDFTYRRRKLSAPETSTIPGVVPTSSTPAAFRTSSPGVGDADQVGNRSGIGVDNNAFGTW